MSLSLPSHTQKHVRIYVFSSHSSSSSCIPLRWISRHYLSYSNSTSYIPNPKLPFFSFHLVMPLFFYYIDPRFFIFQSNYSTFLLHACNPTHITFIYLFILSSFIPDSLPTLPIYLPLVPCSLPLLHLVSSPLTTFHTHISLLPFRLLPPSLSYPCLLSSWKCIQVLLPHPNSTPSWPLISPPSHNSLSLSLPSLPLSLRPPLHSSPSPCE